MSGAVILTMVEIDIGVAQDGIKVSGKPKNMSMQAQLIEEAVGDCCPLNRTCEYSLVVQGFISLLRQEMIG